MTLFEKTLNETKLSKDQIQKLENEDFDDSALKFINNAIDEALEINGSQAIISDILAKLDYKFNEESIKAGFEEFLSNHSPKDLEPLKDYLDSGRDHLASILEKSSNNQIWHMKDYVQEPLASLFSELYEKSQNVGGRRNKGKGEYLLSILLGNKTKFTNDFDLSFGNQKIEVKAYGGRLDGNYTKAATVSPNTCYKILEGAFGKEILNKIKSEYAEESYDEDHDNYDDLFVKEKEDPSKPKRVVLANTPAAKMNGFKFNLQRKSTFILGLGKENIEKHWKTFIKALRAVGVSDKEIENGINAYLKGLYLERYSEYKQEAIVTLVDGICKKITTGLINGDSKQTLARVAELELCLFVETATLNTIDRKLQNLILIGKTSTNDIYVLLIGFDSGDSLGKNLGINVENGNVRTVKFDSSSQGSNIGLKLAGTRK